MKQLANNPVLIWSLVGAVCIALMGVALFYEYVLDVPPCLICVQVRLWVAAIFAIAITGVVFHRRNWVQVGLWLGFFGCSVALIERSWQLLATEYGWIIGDCGVPDNPGLPSWFPLHEWLPALFRPETMCGAPLEMLFGITMAEGTVAFSVLFAMGSLVGVMAAGAKAINL